jgi:adhesin transport system membrane fusion protein
MASHQEDLHFMPDLHAAARRRGQGFAYILTVMTLVFVVVMGLWANYAVLDEVTRGEGRVIPSSKTQIIQNLEGGILAEILVREGDIVEKGDILVRIENTAAQATYRDAQTRVYALQATVERLEAERAGREMALSEEILENAPRAAADQKSMFEARSRQLKAQTAVLEAQAKQRKQEIGEMRSRRKQLERSLQLAREELSITQPLVRNGVMPRIDLIKIERQVADLEGEISTIRLTIPRLQTAEKEARQRVQEVVLSAMAAISDELNSARAELNSVTETLTAGQDRVTRTEVRSRVRGTVKEIKQNTVGGVIRPGEDIIEIVPLDDTLLVEAQIRPADIAFLRPGQEAPGGDNQSRGLRFLDLRRPEGQGRAHQRRHHQGRAGREFLPRLPADHAEHPGPSRQRAADHPGHDRDHRDPDRQQDGARLHHEADPQGPRPGAARALRTRPPGSNRTRAERFHVHQGFTRLPDGR